MVVGLVSVGAFSGHSNMMLSFLQSRESVETGLVAVEHIHIFAGGRRERVVRERPRGRKIQCKDTVFTFENQDFLLFIGHQEFRTPAQDLLFPE